MRSNAGWQCVCDRRGHPGDVIIIDHEHVWTSRTLKGIKALYGKCNAVLVESIQSKLSNRRRVASTGEIFLKKSFVKMRRENASTCFLFWVFFTSANAKSKSTITLSYELTWWTFTRFFSNEPEHRSAISQTMASCVISDQRQRFCVILGARLGLVQTGKNPTWSASHRHLPGQHRH